jgi:outer membrane protein OmpA-like peptidoglycan-associated protein
MFRLRCVKVLIVRVFNKKARTKFNSKKVQISGKGMGESEPKVDCKEACTEEDHAANRRSEFLIVKK